jgi:ABC-type polar amino acid transport system ATPase subunit
MEQSARQPAAKGQPLVTVRGLVKRFGERSVLKRVDLSVNKGETVAVIGPSGGGKSTLLRCLNGLVGWDEGEVSVGPHVLRAGNGPGRNGDATLAARRMVGMIFQDFRLFPHLTALGNVAEAPHRVLRLSGADATSRAKDLLARVGLATHIDHYPQQLSGGQQQRVAIARALAMQPEGLLCDEITSALDPELKHEVLSVLEDLSKDGMTVIMVTHEMGFARRAADRVVVLADGVVAEDGPPAEVLDHPQKERTRQFLRNVMV